jgi:hypothetical protein
MLIGISKLTGIADLLTAFVNGLTLWGAGQKTAKFSQDYATSFVAPGDFFQRRQIEGNIPWQGECDVDVLTSCHQSSSLVFKDLDKASYDSFIREPFHGSRVVLYYHTPTFIDAMFVTATSSGNDNDEKKKKNNETGTNRLQMKDDPYLELVDVSPMVGRVNCDQEPSLCHWVSMFNLQVPTMEVFRWITEEYLLREQKVLLTEYVKLSFAERFQSYGPDSSECLLRRYGAGILHQKDCRNAIDDWLQQQQQDQQQQQLQQPLSSPDMDGTIHVVDHHFPAATKCIRQGRNMALVWNTAVILTCGILLLCLAYAGRSLLRKCVVRCRAGGSSLSSSSSSSFMQRLLQQHAKSTEERQRLDMEMANLCGVVILFGLINMFYPVMLLVVVGPVALIAAAWMGVEVVRAWRAAGNHDVV